MSNHMRVALMIIKRDLVILWQRFFSLFFDGLILVITQTMVIGKLFPLLGMPKEFVAPIFLGSSTFLTLISLGHYKAMDIVNNIAYKEGGDMSYHFVLPTHVQWVLIAYLVSFSLEALIVTGPLIFAGTVILHKEITQSLLLHPHWILFFMIHVLGVIMTGVFFLFVAFKYPVSWFMNNIWTRRIHPIFWLSANLYTYKQVASYAPVFSYILLGNPATYFAEGLRSSLLGSDQYIAPYICVWVLVLVIVFFWYRLKAAVVQSLDPVWRNK